MTTTSHFPVTAAQVGKYFVGQYYQVLQHQPDRIHQFYSDASTMLRIDGDTRETATTMLQIHTLIMSLNYSGIEIKTAHSLESWNGGVLVTVSGSVLLRDFNRRRKFVQTFYLAPQEEGFYVLNDVFHFVDEEQTVQLPVAYLAQSNPVPKLSAQNVMRDQVSLVSNYMLGGDIQARECVAPANIVEDGSFNNYGFAEEQLQKVPEDESFLDNNFRVQSNGLLQNTVNTVQDQLPAHVEETVAELQNRTYASIVAKGHAAPPAVTLSSNIGPTPSEWQHIPELAVQPSDASLNGAEMTKIDAVEEPSAVNDDVQVKSVYVKNVPTTMAPSVIEEEFKKFGELKQDAVAIRTRKDINLCYAFVEFEDISGVQNAIEASTVHIAGHQLFIEGRRPNRNNSYRGRGRGRGRFSYQIEGMRGRFGGQSYGRGKSQQGDSRNYNKPRGNGFNRQTPRQERAY